MALIKQKDLLSFSNTELLHSEEVLKKFGIKRFSNSDYYSSIAIGKEYHKADQNVVYKKLKNLECHFYDIYFDGTDASGSILIDCTLNECKIRNAGFTRSDFTQSKFISANSSLEIINSSFDESNFIYCTMNGLKVEGCSFTNTTFEDAHIVDCSFRYYNFEASTFKNARLENVNLIAAGIDFAEFSGTKVKNAILSLWGILWSFGGLEMVRDFPDEVKIGLPGSKEFMSGNELLKQLKELEAHFYYKKDYFSLVNINIFLGDQEKAFLYLQEGLVYLLKIKNFKMIRFLCKLASENHFFTKKQLSDLYYVLQSDSVLQRMSSYEYKNYLFEMNFIKGLLIDNPFGWPQMIIKLSTNIDNEERNNLQKLLTYIDSVLKIHAPQANHLITIRHNSPFFLEIINSDSLNNIYNFAINFLLGIWGNIPEINALIMSVMNIKKLLSEKSAYNKELKKQEIEMKKMELKNLQLNNELLVKKKEAADLQKELLQLEVQGKKNKLEETHSNNEISVSFSDNCIPSVIIPKELSKRILIVSFSVRYNEVLPPQIREVSIEAPK